MKFSSILLAILNTLPLGLYPFVVIPLSKIAFSGDTVGETQLSHFFGYGFIWGSLLFPVILIFDHTLFVRNYCASQYKRALLNQTITFLYLFLIFVYGFVAMRVEGS